MSAEDPRGIIALLTDFSTADSYVAEMKGVLLSALPGATLVDITHSIPPGDVRSAAHVLGRVRRRFPAGTVHLAVVDPGVGTERAALVVAAGGQFFVGPDNGLFTPVLGEATEVIDLPTPPQAAPTFHGRDLFAPAAAALAAGQPLRRTFGDVAKGALVCYIGSGGEVEIAVRDGSAARRLGIGVGGRVRARLG